MKVKTITEIIGWIGMSMILTAYAFISLKLIGPENLIYSLFNIIGSAGVIYSSTRKKDYQPVVLNYVWIIVAIIVLIRTII
jgi:ABC-type dipeptide/oligopeptide/nickel transport system permease component